MPKVHHREARKDYPDEGIKAGEMYYTWRIKTRCGGITYRSPNAPMKWRLTNSEFLQEVYQIEHQLAHFPDDGCEDDLREIILQIEELGNQQEEKLNNMPEGLQQGSTGKLLEERMNGCQEWAAELEAIEWPDEDDENDAVSEIRGCSYPG